ncbi:transporter [Zunongwangia endophytica]|uniref:Transporter n=1 Tax=Zunongwangia endophytica TaxID=1808945 RepID=A0ABV8HC82_9FLAO|nr:transporter [Zunongwangia endophytica]MDN3594127.1 transporter [Zunongwangia endophytica]
MKKINLAIACFFFGAALFAQNDNSSEKWTASRPDGHAPIGVMGDHVHHKGEWMFSYRYMNMDMEGLNKGSDGISQESVLNDYMVSPVSMDMNMHMLGAMYAPSDYFTLMVMANVIENDMQLINKMGKSFTTSSSGFGDLKLSGMFKVYDQNQQSIHLTAGLSIPTGSIDQKDVTPMSAPMEMPLPYPMQIGSGTWDPKLAVTYLLQGQVLSFGSQVNGVLRLGENDHDYRFGNQLSWNNWIAAKLLNSLSVSARVEAKTVGEIDGSYEELNPMMVTTANTQNQGCQYLNSAFGANFYIPKGAFKNVRLGVEYTLPIYQDLNGIQLKNDGSWTLGLQYSFH